MSPEEEIFYEVDDEAETSDLEPEGKLEKDLEEKVVKEKEEVEKSRSAEKRDIDDDSSDEEDDAIQMVFFASKKILKQAMIDKTTKKEPQVQKKQKKEEEEIDKTIPSDKLYYWDFKVTQYRNFFLTGLRYKKTVLSRTRVKYINFYFNTRLLIYDICFLSLQSLPQLQIAIPMFMELLFLQVVFECQRKYSIFEHTVTFYKLAFQEFALIFWHLVALMNSFVDYGVNVYGLRTKAPLYYLNPGTDSAIQYTAILLIFLAIFVEILHTLIAVMRSLIKFFEDRKKKKMEEETENEMKELEIEQMNKENEEMWDEEEEDEDDFRL
jgi:hypothetical protein